MRWLLIRSTTSTTFTSQKNNLITPLFNRNTIGNLRERTDRRVSPSSCYVVLRRTRYLMKTCFTCNSFRTFLSSCKGMFCTYDLRITNNKNRAGGKLSWRPSFMRDNRDDRTTINWLSDALSKYSYRNCSMLTSRPEWVGVVLSLLMTTWRRICLTLSIMSSTDNAYEQRQIVHYQ